MDKKLKEKFKKIKLLILDVDGVLTDGKMVYDSEARQLKFFNVKDGLGVYLLKLMGIKSIILTADSSTVVKKRAQDMKVEEVYGQAYPKTKFYEEIKRKYKVKDSEVCFIGDDLLDLQLIKKVGLGIAVKDACPEVKRVADYITKKRGGRGAVREVCEFILKSKGLWKKALEKFYLV